MSTRTIISPVLAIALLMAQLLGAAAHCVAVDGNAMQAHHHSVVGSPEHTADASLIGSTSDIGVATGHSHSNLNALTPGADPDTLVNDCVLGSMMLDPGTSGDVDRLYVKLAVATPHSTIPSAHTLSFPTPPPDSHL